MNSQTVDWEVVEGRLSKTYFFDNFARALIFVNKIVNPIEEMQHYPRILIAYNRVTISLFTPEKGVVTDKDYLLAKSIDLIYEN